MLIIRKNIYEHCTASGVHHSPTWAVPLQTVQHDVSEACEVESGGEQATGSPLTRDVDIGSVL